MDSKSQIRWTEDAKARLARVPFFIRPFVRRRAETAAAEQGLSEVTSALLDALKSKEHRGEA